MSLDCGRGANPGPTFLPFLLYFHFKVYDAKCLGFIRFILARNDALGEAVLSTASLSASAFTSIYNVEMLDHNQLNFSLQWNHCNQQIARGGEGCFYAATPARQIPSVARNVFTNK